MDIQKTSTPRPLDPVSVERIKLLHPKRREEALKILREITDTVDTDHSFCRFTYTLRTFAEQQAIYDQGRKTKGTIVTNAKPGQSLHNYGLAIDIAFVINGKDASWNTATDWDNDKKADWMEVVAIFQKYGWEWGGSWKTFKDLPHFQKTDGKSWQDLLTLHNLKRVDKDGYVII